MLTRPTTSANLQGAAGAGTNAIGIVSRPGFPINVACAVFAMSDEDHIANLPIADLVRAYRRKALSPREVITHQLRRIEDYGEAINAFLSVEHDRALAAARESEDRYFRGEPLGLLDGVSFSAKGSLSITGRPFRRGSKATPDAPAATTSPAPARCLESGAVFIGTTTMPDFGNRFRDHGQHLDRRHYQSVGHPQTRRRLERWCRGIGGSRLQLLRTRHRRRRVHSDTCCFDGCRGGSKEAAGASHPFRRATPAIFPAPGQSQIPCMTQSC